MNLRCKQGDLCYIVGGTNNRGRVVEAVEWDSTFDHRPVSDTIGAWCVRCRTPLIGLDEFGEAVESAEAFFPDAWLRPIRDADPADVERETEYAHA